MYACLNVHEPFLTALGYCRSDILRVSYPQVCVEVANSALCPICLSLPESGRGKGILNFSSGAADGWPLAQGLL